jgi:zinc protease
VTEEDILVAARDVLNRDRAVTGYLMAPEGQPSPPTPAAAPPQAGSQSQEISQ